MNEDFLLTSVMIIVSVIMFVVIYLVPIAGVITGSVLLKKKPEKKAPGLAILLISITVCVVILVWKIIDVVNFQ